MSELATLTEEALIRKLAPMTKQELKAYAVLLGLVDANRNYTVAHLKREIEESARFERIAQGVYPRKP